MAVEAGACTFLSTPTQSNGIRQVYSLAIYYFAKMQDIKYLIANILLGQKLPTELTPHHHT